MNASIARRTNSARLISRRLALSFARVWSSVGYTKWWRCILSAELHNRLYSEANSNQRCIPYRLNFPIRKNYAFQAETSANMSRSQRPEPAPLRRDRQRVDIACSASSTMSTGSSVAGVSPCAKPAFRLNGSLKNVCPALHGLTRWHCEAKRSNSSVTSNWK